MRTARHRYDVGPCYYHVFNRVAGPKQWRPFGAEESSKMLAIVKRLSTFYTVEMISFVCMGNHFHAVVRTPCEMPGREEAERRFRAYYGGKKAAPDWSLSGVYEHHAGRMRDVSCLLKDLQQLFTTWFNKTRASGRRGALWAGRFKSVILEPGRAIRECVRYVEMNPVRARITSNADSYCYSTWGLICRSGRHPFGIHLADHLGFVGPPGTDRETDAAVIERLAQRIHAAQNFLHRGWEHYPHGPLPTKAQSHMPVPEIATHSHCWTSGVIVGSSGFVDQMAKVILGDAYGGKKFAPHPSDSKLVSLRRARVASQV